MTSPDLAGPATLRSLPAAPPGGTSRPRPGAVVPEISKAWLRNALTALGVLAAAAAVVSWQAQFAMVDAVKGSAVIASLEAAIPDAGALIFAGLGIALALHGRRALRPRSLNLVCVAISLTMNAMAAGRGWRDVAIWVMPAAVYALASDTLIGVVRARALARMTADGQVLAADEATPLAAAAALLLWLLRLSLAPASTLSGFRQWVVQECPVAPGRRATPDGRVPPALTPVDVPRRSPAGAPAGKQDLLIALAAQRHDLARLPIEQVARLAADIAEEVNLHPGTARRVLRAHVLRLQDANPASVREEART
jgi:hypothetical protein